MGRWVGGWVDGWTDIWTDGWTDGRTVDRRTDRETGRQTDRWIDRQTDRQIDRRFPEQYLNKRVRLANSHTKPPCSDTASTGRPVPLLPAHGSLHTSQHPPSMYVLPSDHLLLLLRSAFRCSFVTATAPFHLSECKPTFYSHSTQMTLLSLPSRSFEIHWLLIIQQ
jgi:hypothetical protein